MIDLARGAYSGSGNPDDQRDEFLWVTVLLASGPANASTPSPADAATYPYGYCPQNTWLWGLCPHLNLTIVVMLFRATREVRVRLWCLTPTQ